jgi:hypothetical protein
MDRDQLRRALKDAIADVGIEELSEFNYRIVLPNFRHAHDSVALGVTEHAGGWTLSDGGQLAYLMDDDYERCIKAMECAGAVFALTESGDVALDVDSDANLVSAILGFAHYLGVAPTVWQSLECARTVSVNRPSSIDVMARETRARVVREARTNIAPYVVLSQRVYGRGESVTAPFAVVNKGNNRPPTLLASFIDTTVSPQAVVNAKKTTTYLWEVVRDLSQLRRYVVVRGPEEDVAHLSDFYDAENINTVTTTDLGTLPRDTEEAVSALAG